LQKIAAFMPEGFDLTNPGTPEHLAGKDVSASFFSTLGEKLALGHDFSPGQDRFGGMPAAIISHRLWREKFGGSATALGKTLTLNGTDYTIVGVLRPEFHFENQDADIYTPIGRGNPLYRNDRTNHGVLCVARLQPGVSIGQARAEMNAIQEHIEELHPATERGQGTDVSTLKHLLVGDVGGILSLLLGAVGLVLLIACANVANLLLAHSAVHLREFAVRRALGASRVQIVRQVLTESVLLSLVAGTLGLVFAKWGPTVILAMMPEGLARATDIGMNGFVVLFALGVSTGVAIVFGLIPALKTSNVDLQTVLKVGGRGATGNHRRTQGALVVAQITLAVVLLTGGSLLLRTIHNLWAVNPGFDTQHVVTFQVGLSASETATAEKVRRAYRDLLGRFRQIPGVQAASFATPVPLSQNDNSGPFWVGTHQPSVSMAEISRALYYWTGLDYLRTMQIPLLRGRFFSPSDNITSQRVVVIDTRMADTYFHGQDPVGKTLTVAHWGSATIIGVVGHVKHWGLGNAEPSWEKPQIYASFYQLSDQWVPAFLNHLTVLVRTPLNTAIVLHAVKDAASNVSSGRPVYNVNAMEQLVLASMASQRLPMLVLSAFAFLALLLASIGVYGVISYSVTQRVHEIGIRMALGAGKQDVLRMILRQGLRLALVGIAIGAGTALVVTRGLASFSRLLYGVQASDPLTLIGVSLLLLSTALLACYIPARRAAQLEPLLALRDE
jgi:predicted permease